MTMNNMDFLNFTLVAVIVWGTDILISESARSSSRLTRKITPSMISNPQADLRHIGHVGYDGVVFGDVSFIGDNYDKLPLKVGNTRECSVVQKIFILVIIMQKSNYLILCGIFQFA